MTPEGRQQVRALAKEFATYADEMVTERTHSKEARAYADGKASAFRFAEKRIIDVLALLLVEAHPHDQTADTFLRTLVKRLTQKDCACDWERVLVPRHALEEVIEEAYRRYRL